MLTGQLRPTSRNAKVMGCDIVQERQELKPQIGVVFDNQNIYERSSARENLRCFARLYGINKSRVEEVLGQVGLVERAAAAQTMLFRFGLSLGATVPQILTSTTILLVSTLVMLSLVAWRVKRLDR